MWILCSHCRNVNGDKFNDIIIGAPKYGEDRGKAFVYYGSKTGSLNDV
ncbi:MAG: FG-GAP repeat protein [Ignavibacteria bacterium]|nr:FG-GAP repeat protein [Ignavibacteria bacterium]